MINSKKAAKKWYPKIIDKEKVSEELLRNAIVFYEQPPERTVNFLNELPADSCERLTGAFENMRNNARKYCQEHKLSKKKEDEIFMQIVQQKIKI